MYTARDQAITTGLPKMTASSEVTCKSKDISKLLAKCEKLVEQYQYDLALQFCGRILSLDPVQLDTLHLKATILIDMGEDEAAKLVSFPLATVMNCNLGLAKGGSG